MAALPKNTGLWGKWRIIIIPIYYDPPFLALKWLEYRSFQGLWGFDEANLRFKLTLRYKPIKLEKQNVVAIATQQAKIIQELNNGITK